MDRPHPDLPRAELPRLRGVLHLHALWVAIIGAGLLVWLAPGAQARLVAGIYGGGLCALFAASALYHRWPGDPRHRSLLRRIDHSVIFVFIAASYTPIAALALDPPVSTIVLVSVWAGALAGVTMSVAWIDAPRGLVAASYVAVGWVIVLALPPLLESVGAAPVALFAAGGALYSLGAAVYAAKRPDPWPRVFGFHELFHALVVAAALAHFVAIAGWIVPEGGA